MATVTNYNMIDFIRSGLEIEIKKTLYKDIMEDLLKQVRLDIDKQLKPLVERIVLGRLERVADVIHFRDELKIYIEVREASEKEQPK